jgi:ADP-ribose pyrophosphatase YjhB (NUDIX family)
MSKRKSKTARGLVTRRIVYTSRQRPDDRPQEIKVNVRRGTIIDLDYAAAMVAIRTHLSLNDVRVGGRSKMTVAGEDPRDVVHDLVAGVMPLDEHEAQDKATTLQWVRSGAPLFRIARPATPDKHLCVYCALFDEERRTVLLVDPVKAGLWLFPGGHVDDGEDPRTTVLQEANEELQITGEFHPRFGDAPLFLTVTRTRGEHSHTDVSFWCVLAADQDMRIEADPEKPTRSAGSTWTTQPSGHTTDSIRTCRASVTSS